MRAIFHSRIFCAGEDWRISNVDLLNSIKTSILSLCTFKGVNEMASLFICAHNENYKCSAFHVCWLWEARLWFFAHTAGWNDGAGCCSCCLPLSLLSLLSPSGPWLFCKVFEYTLPPFALRGTAFLVVCWLFGGVYGVYLPSLLFASPPFASLVRVLAPWAAGCLQWRANAVICPTLCSWNAGCVCAKCSWDSRCWKLML